MSGWGGTRQPAEGKKLGSTCADRLAISEGRGSKLYKRGQQDRRLLQQTAVGCRSLIKLEWRQVQAKEIFAFASLAARRSGTTW